MSIGFYLVGALGLGYLFGFAFAKAKIGERLDCKIKELQEIINQKNLEHISIKKSYRDENREKIHLESIVDEYRVDLDKKNNELTKIKERVEILQIKTKEKDSLIKELETLVLDMQNDYTALEVIVHEKEEENKEQEKLLINSEKNYRKTIEKLTQKANDLFMVKGTDELKNAKDVFDKLREEATKKH